MTRSHSQLIELQLLRRLNILSWVGMHFLAWSQALIAAPGFVDATGQFGVPSGKYFSISLPDLNGDGNLDLWLGNHLVDTPALLMQTEEGFKNRTPLINIESDTDTHGASWADFNNDGWQDMFIAVGADRGTGSHPSHLLKWSGSRFRDVADSAGLASPYARGRSGVWLDWNKDGLLDLLSLAKVRPDEADGTELFIQENGRFSGVWRTTGFNIQHELMFGVVADLGGDSDPDVLVQSSWKSPKSIFQLGDPAHSDLVDAFGFARHSGVYDLAVGDFDGDLIADVYLTNNRHRRNAVSDVFRRDAKHAVLHFGASGKVHEVDIYTLGGITLHGVSNEINAIVGSGGTSVSQFPHYLAMDDSGNHGILDAELGLEQAIYVGYDTSKGAWRIVASDVLVDFVEVMTDLDINDIRTIGFDPMDIALRDMLYVYDTQTAKYHDRSVEAGLTEPTPCPAVVSGDFDNDADLDLVLWCSRSLTALSGRFLENDGSGRFLNSPLLVHEAGGPWSVIGEWWRGAGIVTGDLDNDGCLDLITSGGGGKVDEFFNRKPLQFLLNTCDSGNQWIKLALRGISSNADAIGAKIILTAGGRSQLREIGSETHSFAQNARQVHFGLGANQAVDSLEIFWPSGSHQVIPPQAANQRIEILEEVEPEVQAPHGFVPMLSTDGIHIWKEYYDGPYHIRTSSGSGGWRSWRVQIISEGELTASGASLEGSDALTVGSNWINLKSEVVTNGYDGVDFWAAAGYGVLIRADMDGRSNPRLWKLGSHATNVTPSAWILPREDLEDESHASSNADVHAMTGLSDNTMRIVAVRQGQARVASINLISSAPLQIVESSGLSQTDTLESGRWSLRIDSELEELPKEVKFSPVSDWTGFVVRLDNLLRRDRVSLSPTVDMMPNAFELRPPSPYDAPKFRVDESGTLYVWKDVYSGRWNVAAQGGGSGRWSTFEGEIRSSEPIKEVRTVGLAANDSILSVDSNTLRFRLTVKLGRDMVSFDTPGEAELVLAPLSPGSLPVERIRVGGREWPVQNLPLTLAADQ